MRPLPLILTSLLVFLAQTTFDATKMSKYNVALNKDTCVTQTTLDFAFTSNIVGYCDVTGPCTIGSTAAQTTNLSFLTRYGNDVVLPLVDIAVASGMGFLTGFSTTASTPTGIILKYQQGSTIVYVYTQVIAVTLSSFATPHYNVVDLTKGTSPVNDIKLGLQNIVLSSLNIFNSLDYNQFFTATSLTAPNTFILVNRFIYNIVTTPVLMNSALVSELGGINWDYTTSEKLCYSSVSSGHFQTHLRESYPLWTILIAIFFYWLYYLIPEPTTIDCYDANQQNNYLTCWGFYSLHYLAHEEYFPRLYRSSNLLITFLIQCVFIAGIISSNYTSGSPIIIWAAVIAWATTLPFSFIFGSLFLQPLNETMIAKYELIATMRGQFDHRQKAAKEDELDRIEESLYGYSYWFYVCTFIVMVVCSALAVNLMQKLPRVAYHYHYYWLAAVAVTFALDNLVFDPIFTKIFGHTDFYRSRGFFYDFRLGATYKKIQD